MVVGTVQMGKCKCDCETNGMHIRIKPDGVHELSPHKYQLEQRLENVTVEILRCEECGKVSIGWYRQGNTRDVTNEV